MTLTVLEGGGEPRCGHLLSNLDRRHIWPPEPAPIVYIRQRATRSTAELYCEWCQRVVAAAFFELTSVEDAAIFDELGRKLEVFGDAGVLETVRAVLDEPAHVCADGRHYRRLSYEVWACSDDCELHLLHGAGLDTSSVGLRDG